MEWHPNKQGPTKDKDMDKLEKHIKDKLEERQIAPSPEAWEKIASQLSTVPQKRKRNWYPLAIAASFLGIVLVAYLFFTEESAKEMQPQVVEGNQRIENVEEINGENTFIPDEVIKEQTTLAENAEQPKSKEANKQTFEEGVPKENRELALQTPKTPINIELEQPTDQMIALKVEEVVAQVEFLEHQKQEVSDAEVDSLLRRAQRQILTDKLFAQSGSVDAMSLLAEVEDELDESFRDQIFDALKDGYLKLRTAVADRNN
jgi:hypothetical protein